MVGRKRLPWRFSKKCFAAMVRTGCSDSTSSDMVSVKGDRSLLTILNGSTSGAVIHGGPLRGTSFKSPWHSINGPRKIAQVPSCSSVPPSSALEPSPIPIISLIVVYTTRVSG